MSGEERIRAELVRAAREMGVPDGVEPQIERPRDPSFGDWATNYAMQLARHVRRPPADIARDLAGRIDRARAQLTAVEVAAPGFINFRVDTGALAGSLARVVTADAAYGRADVGGGRDVVVEFVSANPTGPLHVGHGRQAALGDAIATLLEWTGWHVSREFYYNDAGAQIANLGLSVQARIAERTDPGAVVPEGGYHGEYIREIAGRYLAEHPEDPAGRDLDAITRFAVSQLRREQDADLQALGVRFDTYYLESSLYTDGRVEATVRDLQASGHAYEQDGALWLRTTRFGDDQDRVMRRSAAKGGAYTYFVPDVAYHVTKWERGFRRAINVQGADHHGTIARVRAGLQALDTGVPAGYPEYLLHQMVTVVRGGAEVKISKRAGSYVTVRDLVDEVGRDAVRYFFLMRKADSQLEFDVDLARAQSEENPVYYIQMAHARMSGIFRVGEVDPASVDAQATDLAVLDAPAERAVIKSLTDFPRVVAEAADALEPHRVAAYLLDTARQVHNWYHRHHVLGEAEAVERARLVLARASQIVLRNGLTLLGIAAPERM